MVELGIRSARQTTGRSVEPWASAQSKPRPRAKRSSSATRPAAARALPARATPPYRPSASYRWPQSSSSSSVCDSGRAVISTSCPSRSSSSTSGLSTSTWAVLVRSTQTRMRSGAAPVLELDELLDHHLERGVLDAEPLGEHALEASAHAVQVLRRVGAHVRGQCGEARGHGPDVQVVHLPHALHARHRLADLLDV